MVEILSDELCRKFFCLNCPVIHKVWPVVEFRQYQDSFFIQIVHHILWQWTVRKPGHVGTSLLHHINVFLITMLRQCTARCSVIRHPVVSCKPYRLAIQLKLVSIHFYFPNAKPVLVLKSYQTSLLQIQLAFIQMWMIKMPQRHLISCQQLIDDKLSGGTCLCNNLFGGRNNGLRGS